MDIIQLIIVGFVSLFIFLAVNSLCVKFGRKDLAFYGVFPLALFVSGFIMRLSRDSMIIDVGFFLTEIAYLLLTSFFVIALLLGQLKYHKK